MSPEPNNSLQDSVNQMPEIEKGWRNQVSEGLLWLDDRAWSLAGLILFVSALYLNGFILEEKVPLSITSPSVIAALPMLFAFLLLFIGMLVGLLFSPTMIFFSPLNKSNPVRLVDSFSESKPGKIKLTIFISWLLLPACLLGVTFGIWMLVPKDVGWINGIAIFFLVPITGFVFVNIFIRAQSSDLHWRDISPEFWMSLFIGLIPQFFLTVFVIIVSMRAAQPSESYVIFAFWSAIGLFALCLIQLLGVRIVASTESQPPSLAACFTVGFAFVILLGIYPPAASKLTGAVLKLTASGARTCAVLTWTSNNPDVAEEVNNVDSGSSKPLHILMAIDENYVVRPTEIEGKAVYFVPRSMIAGIDDCPINSAK